MSSTNSAGDYLALDSTSPASTSFITSSGAGANQVTRFGTTIVYNLVQKALNAGCDGGMGWTRGNGETENVTSLVTFASQKLPTVEKAITSIDGVAYTEGMCAEVGDVIVYTVTVTQYATTEAIAYSAESLIDNLSGATFTSSTTNSAEIEFAETTLSADTTYTYTVTYTVQNSDLNTDLLNTVSLSYSYKSEFSTGTFSGSATAECAVTVVNFYPTGIVMDYGLPMVINYSSHHGSYDLVSGSVEGGTITVSGNYVTVTMDSVLTGVVTATLKDTQGTEYTFKIYPATTVYYEETFATYGTGWSVNTTDSNGWSTSSSGTSSTQEAHTAMLTSPSYYNYGSDAAYTGDTEGSDGTSATTETVGDTLTFTFTGTGVDIFANCDSGSGMVAIQVVKNNDDNTTTIEKFLFIDMENTGDYSTGTTAYNTPIATISGLTHGSYTVTIYLVSAGSTGFQFDGFRVYDTIEQDKTDTTSDAYTIQTTIYANDDEDYPDYYDLRDYVLTCLEVDTSDSEYEDDISSTLAQVYATSGSTSGVLVISDTSSGLVQTPTDSSVNAQTDFLDNGPKNELYIYPGATVVFSITTEREVQIGMRSVTGLAVSYKISATDSSGSVASIAGTTDSGSISSSVDMFYDLVEKDSNGNSATYTITITNNSTNGSILSLTDIKISDCNESNIFDELTAETVVAALENSKLPAQAWSVSGTLSEAATEAAEKISANAYKILELLFNRTYTGDITFSVADLAESLTGEFTGDKVLLLQPSSDDPDTYVLTGESLVDEDGNVTFSITDPTDGILVIGTNGDVTGDGSVNASDTLALLRGVSGRATLSAVQSGFADVNLDGTVNSNDLLAVVKYVSGRTSSLN